MFLAISTLLSNERECRGGHCEGDKISRNNLNRSERLGKESEIEIAALRSQWQMTGDQIKELIVAYWEKDL